MLRVVTGRFHPELEFALVDHLTHAKVTDPLATIAIVVPSKPLADRLRTLFTVEHRLSFLNLRVLTFHQLALRLAEEAAAHPLPRVVDELFFEQLVRHIVRNNIPSQAPLQRIGQSSGTWGALWGTIRDLKDADVDPGQALQGLREGYFDDDREWLGSLITLYAGVKEAAKTLGVGTQDDLAASLIPVVSTASFLRPLSEVLYYGFYDLTQVQLSLFEAVSRAKNTTLFFPLEDDAAYGFARRFFARYIQPLVTSDEATIRLKQESPVVTPRSVQLTVRSMIGAEEELSTTCRTILDLVETNGYRFDQIGIAARTLDPYRPYVQSVFDRHRIPFYTTTSQPLIEEPICKLILLLVSLPLNDFYRASVLDVVTSPLYATDLHDDRSMSYRPEQWKVLVQALHITHGAEEWKRLEQASQASVILDGGETLVDALAIAPEVIGLLWQVVSQLMEDCSILPFRGTIGRMVTACRELVDRRLRRLEAATSTADADVLLARQAMTWHAIDRLWLALMELEPLNEEMTWVEFVELLTHTFERTTRPFHDGASQGVMVCDVMGARGVPFKALFILGLNEKVFPRYIREDAFLRDCHRRVFDATLGFKVDEKLAAYGEESLLFHLCCQAASHRLFLSYQRADESGRMLAASPFLGEARRRFAHGEQPIDAVPRRLSDRVLQQPSITLFLPPNELTQWLAINGQDPTDLVQALGRDVETLRHGASALERIEENGTTLNCFDGITGTLEAHWSRVIERGLAPTPLERYARCPFQYFLADVLRLEPSRVAIGQEPDTALIGTLCHASLRRVYEQLVKEGWPAEQATGKGKERTIRASVEQAAAHLESQHRTGHYLLWELVKELIAALVIAAVEADEAEQLEHPYTPVAFEVEGEGAVPDVLHEGSLKIRGRIDRLDRHRMSGALRVLDYKFKAGSAMKPEDRHLAQSAVRGYRLQPPLYSCLAIPGQPPPSHVQFLFLAPQWDTVIRRSTFEATSWASDTGTLIRNTIKTLADGIRAGRFFILPDGYCDGCGFRVACRREHAPTWWRAHRAAEPKTLKTLRVQKIADE